MEKQLQNEVEFIVNLKIIEFYEANKFKKELKGKKYKFHISEFILGVGLTLFILVILGVLQRRINTEISYRKSKEYIYE